MAEPDWNPRFEVVGDLRVTELEKEAADAELQHLADRTAWESDQ